jgi:hypothetical protein
MHSNTYNQNDLNEKLKYKIIKISPILMKQNYFRYTGLQSVICGSLSPWHGGPILRLWVEVRPSIWRVAVNILSEQSCTADKG